MNIGWPAIILFCSVCSNLPGYEGLSQLRYKVHGHGVNYMRGMHFVLFFYIVLCYPQQGILIAWWRHQMETLSALLAICAGNSPVPGEFPAQRPVTRSFDVFFDLHPNKRLSKHSRGWWFETPSRSLWRHRNVALVYSYDCANAINAALTNRGKYS